MQAGERVILNNTEYVANYAKRGRCRGCVAFENIELCNALPYCGDIDDGYIIFEVGAHLRVRPNAHLRVRPNAHLRVRPNGAPRVRPNVGNVIKKISNEKD